MPSSRERGYTKRSLVAWSGGIDSTYILSRLLRDTDDDVIAMHIRMYDHYGRYKEEQKAIDTLYKKLSAIREFKVIPLAIDFSQLGFKTFDMCVVGFGFGAVIRHLYGEGLQVDRLVIGTHEREGHWQKRWDQISRMIAVNVETANFPHDSVPLMLPNPMPTKKQEISYLKNNHLFDDCWYCRQPEQIDEKFVPCGVCKTCEEVAEAVA